MDMLKLRKYGIKPTDISSALQLSHICDAIDAEERKVSLIQYQEVVQKEHDKQCEEKRHQENLRLAKESNELNRKTLQIAIWAFVISVISLFVSLLK